MITAIRASSCLPYASSDVGTGRCRMSKTALQRLNITRMGSVLTLLLSIETKQVSVLCTAWLDTSGYLDDNTICLDDAVVIGSDTDCPSWVEAECKLIKTDAPTILTSVHVDSLRCAVKNADLLGLAVGPNCRINLPHSIRPISSVVCRTSSGGVGVVSSHCLMIKGQSSLEAGKPLHTDEETPKNNYSSISVVREIAYRTVLPYVVMSSEQHSSGNHSMSLLRGVLVVGPPGVGKTYAVKAVQSFCAHACKVRIFEVSIPSLLSEADPVQVLDKQFAAVAALRRTPATACGDVNDGEMQSPGTPSKSSYLRSAVSTPGSVASSASVVSTPFATPSSSSSSSSSAASAQRNNTFAYRSPAVMSASAAAASAATSAAATPLTNKKAGLLNTVTPCPSTPVGKTPLNTTSKKGLLGGRTPPPTSFKDMLAASRVGKKSTSSAETPVTPTAAAVSEAPQESGTKENEQESMQYLPEMAFIVIDEIDALGNAGQQNENQIAIKQYLCQWLDKQGSVIPRAEAVYTCLVGTSNRSGDIDPALRRGGRLEHEIAVLNTQEDRRCLLESLLSKVFGENGSQYGMTEKATSLRSECVSMLADKIAMQTGGYVAADLTALVRTMHKLSLEKESVSGLDPPNHQNLDSDVHAEATSMLKLFHVAAKSVQPSCLRGATITLPNLTFDDVIGYEEVKSSLQRVLCFAKPEQQALSSRFGLHSSPGGVLLHGPPGNSKTRLASAAAAHHGLPMISLSAADIYSPYVGDAEAEVRRAFQLARQAAPCVLFIDELDSIVTNRDNDSGGAGSTSASVEGRVLATLLTEMDGIQNTNDSEFSHNTTQGGNSSGGVIVLGATNRLDFIDAALLRKGRFHHVLLVPLPNAAERIQLLNYFAKKCGLLRDGATEASEELLLKLREGMSGAEIENLCREATLDLHRKLMQ